MIQRSSDVPWLPSGRDRARGSRNTVIASSNETSCLARLLTALAGSQANSDRLALSQLSPEGAVLEGGEEGVD